MTTPPNTPDRSAELMLLGQIHGIVQGLREGQQRQDDRMLQIEQRIEGGNKALGERMDGIDGRLRTVEQKAAVNGAISGGAMGIGMALIVEGLKQWMRGNTPSP